MRYLPPFEIIKGMLHLTTTRGRTRVDMAYEDMQKMVRILLSGVDVDEEFYLLHNPDVGEGIRSGTIRLAREHFADLGYFEGRLPYFVAVDEEWYRANHPDILETIETGDYKSGQDHFDGPGYSEGRKPYGPLP
jgi:hypothetical protein